jgi:hypothetical protein
VRKNQKINTKILKTKTTQNPNYPNPKQEELEYYYSRHNNENR